MVLIPTTRFLTCGVFMRRFFPKISDFMDIFSGKKKTLWPIIVKKKKKNQKMFESCTKSNKQSTLHPVVSCWIINTNTLLRQKRALTAHLTVFYSFKTNNSGFLRFPSLGNQEPADLHLMEPAPPPGGCCSEAPALLSALRSREEKQGAAAALNNS